MPCSPRQNRPARRARVPVGGPVHIHGANPVAARRQRYAATQRAICIDVTARDRSSSRSSTSPPRSPLMSLGVVRRRLVLQHAFGLRPIDARSCNRGKFNSVGFSSVEIQHFRGIALVIIALNSRRWRHARGSPDEVFRLYLPGPAAAGALLTRGRSRGHTACPVYAGRRTVGPSCARTAAQGGRAFTRPPRFAAGAY